MKNRKETILAFVLLTAFILWTVAVCTVDVHPIGPNESSVGFATLNHAFHDLFGVHMLLYTVTDWLSIFPLLLLLGFGVLGLYQWISRKQILHVDRSILILGGFYLVVLSSFLFFENCIINYRPILIEGVLEASYPSSTTMLVLCVLPTTVMQLKERMRNPVHYKYSAFLLTIFGFMMVLARLFSGVHWLSDILGGILLSASLVLFYKLFAH